MTRYHFMGPKIDVWDRDALRELIETEGLTITGGDQSEIIEVLGMKVVCNPALPPGRCEVRHPETGELLMAFDVKT